MSPDAEPAVIFLHQVKIGDLFYSGPSAVRAWMRECYDEGPRRELVELPVERGGPPQYMDGMSPVCVRGADGTIDSAPS